MGASQFVEDIFQRQEFDAALVRIDPGPDPDLYPFWHSTQAFGEGRNLVAFSHADADQLLEDARQTPSVAQRAEDYLAFQEIFAQELPAVLLYTQAYQYVYRADLQAVSPGLLFTLSARFYDVHLWFVETEPSTDDGA
jgi:peptide/nickel transport system substrate-binding protein